MNLLSDFLRTEEEAHRSANEDCESNIQKLTDQLAALEAIKVTLISNLDGAKKQLESGKSALDGIAARKKDFKEKIKFIDVIAAPGENVGPCIHKLSKPFTTIQAAILQCIELGYYPGIDVR